MDACLTEEAPAQAIKPARPRLDAGCWIRWAGLATIAVGLIWRLVRYFEQFPIWGDEAMLLLNIDGRDYAGLTQHLDYAQVAPLLFLWLEKTAILLFGTSEWSVHLFPMLMGLLAFGLFWRVCRTAFTPMVAGLAVGILAVSYYPVRHGCEVKPYVFDLGYAALYLWLTLGHVREPDRWRWLIGLAVMTPLAVFSSYPSVFVAGSASLVLLPTMRSASWSQRGLYVAFNALMLGSFIVHFGFVGHHQIDAEEAQRTREFLRNYWKDAFPPESLPQWPIWLVKVFTGNTLAYPIGAKNGGSIVTLLFVLIGSVKLWRTGQRSLLALCWLPFALNLLAAILGKYPFGDSARITLHLCPFICIMTAHGIGQALDCVSSPAWRTRLHLACYVLLFGCGLAGLGRDFLHPYKTEHDHDMRALARDIARDVQAAEPVVLEHAGYREVLAEFLWDLRAEHLPIRWQSACMHAEMQSHWRVQCSHTEPGAPIATAGWRIISSKVRLVPPENDKMHTVYCRWMRLERAADQERK